MPEKPSSPSGEVPHGTHDRRDVGEGGAIDFYGRESGRGRTRGLPLRMAVGP
jgi:hypothetical protein